MSHMPSESLQNTEETEELQFFNELVYEPAVRTVDRHDKGMLTIPFVWIVLADS